MTDKVNPIAEAWEKHPECRADFIKQLMNNYKSLYERIEEEAINTKISAQKGVE